MGMKRDRVSKPITQTSEEPKNEELVTASEACYNKEKNYHGTATLP